MLNLSITHIDAALFRVVRATLPQADTSEPSVDRGTSGLGCIALAPIVAVKTPCDLDRRRERRFEFHTRQSDGADERRDARSFDRPFAATRFGQMLLHAIDASLSSRVRTPAKNRMTVGSAFCSAKRGRSASRQGRRINRAVSIIRTPGVASRKASPCLRLPGRPRLRETNAGGPSDAKARRDASTPGWRRRPV
jgi:hypothetical protein